MKGVFLLSLFLGFTAAANESRTLECRATSSWFHEANFKTVVGSSNKWTRADGGSMLAALNLTSVEERMKIRVDATSEHNGNLLTLTIGIWDVKTGHKSQTSAQGTTLQSRLEFPVPNPGVPDPNQLDIECVVR